MRKLVTVRTVSELRPIVGADLIELAIMDGWQCVVKKGEFKVGDKGLYFEIDSFVPANDERFKFLEKNFTLWRNHYGARIRTIKLRGQISQGLLLPVTSFPEVKTSLFLEDTKDYSQVLGILKWERDSENDKPKEQKKSWLGTKLKKLRYTKLKPFVLWLEKVLPMSWLQTDATHPFPNFIPRTDEERVQNLIGKEGFFNDDLYITTIKYDGSSMTVYNNRGKQGVCSRNLDLKKDEDNKFWACALKYKLPQALKKLKMNLAIQGELMGPGIQGNREGFKEHEYFIYKVWDIGDKRYLGDVEMSDIADELTGLGAKVQFVKALDMRTTSSFKTIDDFLAYAEGPSHNAPTREGVVFTKCDGTKGFKVIATSYLLKEDK